MQRQVKDIDRLVDIVVFCELIIDKMEGLEEEHFHSDEVIKWAFLKWLENIGEAANQLSQVTILEFDKQDWRSIIHARHFYVHHYFDVEWPTVWRTLKTIDFLGMKIYAEEIIKNLRLRHLQ